MTKIIFEWDDLNPHKEVDCLPVIEKLILSYPSIILNFFTIPYYKGMYVYSDSNWLNKIKKYVDLGNINIAAHGTEHTFREYAFKNYQQSIDALSKTKDIFQKADLSFHKVFRAPYWGLCEDSVRALIDMGYTHLYSHKEYTTLNEKYADRIKIVYYNWNMKDEWPKLENPLESDIVVAHGHTAQWPHLSCGNGIWECYDRLCSFIDSQDNIEFLRIDQYE